MSQVIHGKVHGTTIELYQPLGIPDGQEVELTLQTVPAAVEARQWGDGLRRCAGALANIPGLDQDMERTHDAGLGGPDTRPAVGGGGTVG